MSTVKEQADDCIKRWQGKKDKEAKGILMYSKEEDEYDAWLRKCDIAAWVVVLLLAGGAVGSLLTLWCLS